MNYVIGLAGKAQSGKSTSREVLMDLIEEKFKRYTPVHISFAAPLKKIATEVFGWDGDKELYFPMTGDIDTPIPDKGRQLLINIGQGFRAIRPTIWADLAAKEIDDLVKNHSTTDFIFVIDDLRFQNEMKVLEKYGENFIRVKMERGSAIEVNDISEKDLELFSNWDAVIYNNGNDRQELKNHLEQLINALIEGVNETASPAA